MQKNYNLHLTKIVKLLKSGNAFSKQNNLFIKHYNTFDVPVDEVRLAVGDNTNIKILTYRFSTSRMQDAYEPIMGWIRDLYLEYEEDDIDTFLDKAQSYKLHNLIFKSYIKTKKCKRIEEVFIPEIQYDKQKFIKSLISILEYLSAKVPLILILNRLHFSSLSMVDFLEAFIANKDLSKISIFVSYNESYHIDKHILPQWNKLFEVVKAKIKIIDLGTKEKFDTAIERTNFIPITSRYRIYIEKLENMIATLAFDQAYFYLELICHKMEMEKSSVELDIRRSLFENFIIACIYKNDMNRASIMCDKLKLMKDKNENSSSNYNYYRLLTLTKVYSSQNNDAQKAVAILSDIAQELSDDYLIFKAMLTRFLVNNEGFKEITIHTNFTEVNDTLLYNLEKYNCKNILAYILVMCFDNIDTKIVTEEEKYSQESFFEKGIEIATLLGNYNCTLAAYKKCVVMASFYGNYEKVDLYNNKCLEIVHIMNNPLEEAGMCNTLGYNTLIIEDFKKANIYFNRAISILTKDNKIELLCETLYNKGMNAIAAKDYKAAMQSLETCIEMMKNMNMHRLPVCNISKIYGLTSFCYYKLGKEYNLNLLLSKTQRILSHLLNTNDEGKFYLWDDDLFLYYFCNGLIDMQDEKYLLAQIKFDKARYHIDRTKGCRFLFDPVLAIEQAKLYRINNDEIRAINVLRSCIDYCVESGYKSNIDLIMMHIKNEKNDMIQNDITLLEDNIDNDKLVELSIKTEMIVELNKKRKEMDFLYTLQDVVSEQTNKENLISIAMTILRSNFNLDEILYLKNEGSKFEINYVTSELLLDEHQIEVINNRLEFESNGFAVSRLERKFENYKDIISYFGIDKVWSLICVPIVIDDVVNSILIAYNEVQTNTISNQTILKEDDIGILKYAFRQISDAIEKINAREKIIQINNALNNSSITDVLTGALNRLGFIEKINELNESLLDSRGNHIKELTVLYIDLDNFKYYNDNFGHDVGDLILKEFTKLFTKVLGEKGYCVRYGGDEFVLILYGANEKDGEDIAKKVYEEVVNAKYFIDKVEEIMNEKIEINNESKISCSIGIADTKIIGKLDINETLKRADLALHYVKTTDKRGYKLWSSMKIS